MARLYAVGVGNEQLSRFRHSTSSAVTNAALCSPQPSALSEPSMGTPVWW